MGSSERPVPVETTGAEKSYILRAQRRDLCSKNSQCAHQYCALLLMPCVAILEQLSVRHKTGAVASPEVLLRLRFVPLLPLLLCGLVFCFLYRVSPSPSLRPPLPAVPAAARARFVAAGCPCVVSVSVKQTQHAPVNVGWKQKKNTRPIHLLSFRLRIARI